MSADVASNESVVSLEPYWRPPLALAHMRIGLMGGSFDPPHEGHLHISLQALKRLRLDQVWWLVSPGNPLKRNGPWPLPRRLAQCERMARHPRIKVTAFEQALGSPYTSETLHYLTRRLPRTRFTWLMGADNLAGVHRWRNWRAIFETVPVAVIERPGELYTGIAGRAAHIYAAARLPARAAAILPLQPPPSWTLLNIPLTDKSSTRIRRKRL